MKVLVLLFLASVVCPIVAFADKPVVYVSNYPLAYFSERIGGDAIELRYPVEADIDPAFWEIPDEVIVSMQSAEAILLNGATYEKWLPMTALPDSTVFETASGFSDQFIVVKDATVHKHGDGVEHSHDGIAFTTWLDFGLARKQATVVRDVLARVVPDSAEEIGENAAKLDADLARLDEDFRKAGKALEGTLLFGSHPVYQYLARAYGFAIEAVHWEPEIVPDTEAFGELEELAKKHPAKWMLWEGEPAAASVEKLKAIGVSSIVVAPCGNRPENGDWLATMRANLEALRSMVE